MTYDEFKEKLLGEIGERLGKPAVKIITVTLQRIITYRRMR